MQKRNDYRSLEKVLLFVTMSIDWSAEYEMTATKTTEHTRYSEVIVEVKGDMGLRVCCEKDLARLDSKIEKFKKVLKEVLGEYCDSALYTLQYHVLDHMMEDIRDFGTVSVLDGGL